MLGSIEKGRKLPQFGRRHNVTFFNKMYPLSWLALMQPKWAFHCILSVTLPAREGSWHCVPGVTKSLCVPTRFSHSSEGLRGELLCYFSQVLSQMVFDRRPEGLSVTAGAGWRQQCHMPMGVGAEVESNSDWGNPVTDCSLALTAKSPLSREQANIHDWNGRAGLIGERQGLEGTTGHRSLLIGQFLALGCIGFHGNPASQVANYF